VKCFGSVPFVHPVYGGRALKSDYSADQLNRDLQLEAKVHISVQKWIGNGAQALEFLIQISVPAPRVL